jgi:hypothetical protein
MRRYIMNTNEMLRRLEYVRAKHKKQHAIVEALEGENAPEKTITAAKKLKLSLKDEISAIESTLASEGIRL